MVWRFVSPPNFYVEILTPKEMVLGQGPLGGDEVMTVEPSWMGLVPLLYRPQRAPLPLPQGEDTARRPPVNQEAFTRHWLCWWLDLRLPRFHNCEKYISIVYKPVLYSVRAAWMGQGLHLILLRQILQQDRCSVCSSSCSSASVTVAPLLGNETLG